MNETTNNAETVRVKAGQQLQLRLNMVEIVSGALAVIVVSGVVFIAIFGEIHTGKVPDLPSWLTAVVGAIVGAYFGARSGSVTNGHG